ncbi:hypothetical protein PanWU01x14_236210 [Parasponia andersonii]|uniref:Uncharacterized protein n=1 Tax=Parasponia andersonii TaxID=3476 RepID=A0A2P5BIF2_PARAD|nr:hypothetical protein PanWU01x14_236210 [Parasponia andersonii]
MVHCSTSKVNASTESKWGGVAPVLSNFNYFVMYKMSSEAKAGQIGSSSSSSPNECFRSPDSKQLLVNLDHSVPFPFELWAPCIQNMGENSDYRANNQANTFTLEGIGAVQRDLPRIKSVVLLSLMSQNKICRVALLGDADLQEKPSERSLAQILLSSIFEQRLTESKWVKRSRS